MVSILKETGISPIRQEKLDTVYLEDQWRQTNFDILVELGQRNGPFVEIGGPTPRGYDLVDLNLLETLGRRLLVTNIFANGGSVEMLASAKSLPFGGESLGAVFASMLPLDTRHGATEEVYKSLENGGLFIYQGVLDQDVEHALRAGFKLLEYSRKKPNVYNSNENAWNLVLQKPE